MNAPWIAPLVLILACSAPVRAQAPPADPVAPAPGGAPRAVFEKVEIDAGDVTRGEELPVTFVVRNTGDAMLKILSAKPG